MRILAKTRRGGITALSQTNRFWWEFIRQNARAICRIICIEHFKYTPRIGKECSAYRIWTHPLIIPVFRDACSIPKAPSAIFYVLADASPQTVVDYCDLWVRHGWSHVDDFWLRWWDPDGDPERIHQSINEVRQHMAKCGAFPRRTYDKHTLSIMYYGNSWPEPMPPIEQRPCSIF